jgi:hypothetical protein
MQQTVYVITRPPTRCWINVEKMPSKSGSRAGLKEVDRLQPKGMSRRAALSIWLNRPTRFCAFSRITLRIFQPLV